MNNVKIMTGELILRLLMAGILGAAIGFEREIRAKGAGIRTHVLVALGSALFMIISQYGFAGAERFDAARVAAQVVSGIGFIGAGIIIFQKNRVSGLTTAAGLWVTASIGLGAGCGLYVVSAVCTVFVMAILEAMHFITIGLGDKYVTAVLSSTDQHVLSEAIRSMGKKAERFSLTRAGDRIRAEVTIRVPAKTFLGDVADELSALPDVQLESLE